MYKEIIAKINSKKEWLPLYIHSEDTKRVMQALAEDYVSKNFLSGFNMDKGEFIELASATGGLHDIGKATVSSQTNMSAKVCDAFFVKQLDKEVALKSQNTKHRHELASEEILLFKGCNESIAAVIGAHHGAPHTEPDKARTIQDRINYDFFDCDNTFWDGTVDDDDLPGKFEKWNTAWDSLIQNALEGTRYKTLSDLPKLSTAAQILLWGMLITADWIASTPEYFPLFNEMTNGNIDAMYPKRALIGIEKVALTKPWETNIPHNTNDFFEETFGFPPNDFQKEILEIVFAIQKPGITIIEQSMGKGKTEAGLAAAVIINTFCNAGGLAFFLPTQATTNGLFPRIVNFAQKQSKDCNLSIKLAHANANQNEDFKAIMDSRQEANLDSEDVESGLEVNAWLNGHKRTLLSNFVVGTIDQLLLASLKRKHFCMRYYGLANKIVIIDEAHSYDAYMDEYLETTLAWLHAMRCPVIILSATLTPQKRAALVEAYTGNKDVQEILGNVLDYPLVTWTDGDTIHTKKLRTDDEDKSVKTRKLYIRNNSQIVEELKQKLKNGGVAGVIVNTVNKCQEIAKAIIDSGEFDNVIVDHARNVQEIRLKIEHDVLEVAGKKSKNRNENKTVIVGTQVLEQSLDIDLDFLMTEICPVDLLLQRIGRLHRHSGRIRPRGLEEPECVVLTGFEKQGSEEIYTKYLLDKTKKVIKHHVSIPSDIPQLVSKVYRTEGEPGSTELEKYLKKIDKKKESASTYLLSSPRQGAEFVTLLNGLDTATEIEGAVRDGEMSISPILLIKREDRYETADGTVIDIQEKPSSDTVAKLLKQKVNLSKTLSEMVEEQLDSSYEKCALLRKDDWLRFEKFLIIRPGQYDEKLGVLLKESGE